MNDARKKYEQARTAQDAGRFEDAVVLFRESAKIVPHFKAFELLGDCLMNLGSTAQAIGPLAAATALNKGVRPPSLLAEAFYLIGDLRKANEFAALALERDAANRKARVILKLTETNKRLHEIPEDRNS